jgi:hypothetical protein
MNTSKLHVMKFKEGMAGEDYVKWQKAVERWRAWMSAEAVSVGAGTYQETLKRIKSANINLSNETKGQC